MRQYIVAGMILLGLIAAGMAQAGELAPELTQLAAAGKSDTTVHVWITLRPSIDKSEVQAMAAATDRGAGHKFMIARFKAAAASTQEKLVADLTALKSAGRVSRIRTHWVADVVEADVTADQLTTLAARDDVEIIMPEPELRTIQPIAAAGALAPMANYEPPHIASIRADSAWKLGYTGTGRVVCSFDNGVDGNHEALHDAWKGLDGDSAAAWFDPVTQQKAPHVVTASISNSAHGTHTMGLMVGRSDSVRCGVAPDAKWISAAVIDIRGASILDAFEWAADPDGDPNTVADVPDVINHSWALSPNSYYLGCKNVVFDAITRVEALGIVNVFAAGNDGTVGSVNNPANGVNSADDSLSFFAVGALNISVSPPSRAGISSQGPSVCMGATKPNVMAPGQGVYSTYPANVSHPEGTYQTLTGTSMATPQVAGLVALLRQKKPNATVDEIKLAILNSTNQVLESGAFPNDSLGWGEIDCVGALETLSGVIMEPDVRLYDFTHGPIAPGDTVEGTLVMENRGLAATSVAASLAGSDPTLIVLAGTANFGTIDRGDTVRSGNIIRVAVSDTVTSGTLLSLPLILSGSNFGPDTMTLSFLVGARGVKTFASHSTGMIDFTVSNFGVYGMGAGSIFPAGGLGFTFDGGVNDIWEAGILAANGPVRVVGAVHQLLNEPRMDFAVAPGGNLVYQDPGPLAPQQTYAAFADTKAPIRLGINVVQESFSFDGPDNNFVILRYILQNDTTVAINDINFGLFFDWDIGTYNANSGKFESSDSILWQAWNRGTVSVPLYQDFRGLVMLDGPLYTALTRRSSTIYNTWYIPGSADGFTDAERYQALFRGLADSIAYRDSLYDLFQLMAAGPIDLAPGGLDTVAFAVVAGDNLVGIRDAATRAKDKYHSVITDVEPGDGGTLPSGFALRQNYPNPFNPSTKISFSLPRESNYMLRIYNLLGQEVERMSGHSRAGTVELVWEAKDHATGMYLYRLEAGAFTASRKMLLLK